jgi:hypothetical protein
VYKAVDGIVAELGNVISFGEDEQFDGGLSKVLYGEIDTGLT